MKLREFLSPMGMEGTSASATFDPISLEICLKNRVERDKKSRNAHYADFSTS